MRRRGTPEDASVGVMVEVEARVRPHDCPYSAPPRMQPHEYDSVALPPDEMSGSCRRMEGTHCSVEEGGRSGFIGHIAVGC